MYGASAGTGLGKWNDQACGNTAAYIVVGQPPVESFLLCLVVALHGCLRAALVVPRMSQSALLQRTRRAFLLCRSTERSRKRPF
jgi:hypothetical protein